MSEAKTLERDQLLEVEVDYMELDSIIEKEFNSDKENLIMILQRVM